MPCDHRSKVGTQSRVLRLQPGSKPWCISNAICCGKFPTWAEERRHRRRLFLQWHDFFGVAQKTESNIHDGQGMCSKSMRCHQSSVTLSDFLSGQVLGPQTSADWSGGREPVERNIRRLAAGPQTGFMGRRRFRSHMGGFKRFNRFWTGSKATRSLDGYFCLLLVFSDPDFGGHFGEYSSRNQNWPNLGRSWPIFNNS